MTPLWGTEMGDIRAPSPGENQTLQHILIPNRAPGWGKKQEPEPSADKIHSDPRMQLPWLG